MKDQVEANWTLTVFIKEAMKANISDDRLKIRLS